MGKTSSKPKTQKYVYTYQFVPSNDHEEVDNERNNENNDDNAVKLSSTSIIQDRIFERSKEHSSISGDISEEETISTHSYSHLASIQHDVDYIEPGSVYQNNIDVELTPPCNPHVHSIGKNSVNPCLSIANHPFLWSTISVEQYIINNLTKENLEWKKLRQTYRNQFNAFIKIINRQGTEIKQLKIELQDIQMLKHDIKSVNVDSKTNEVQQNSLDKDTILDEGVDKSKTILVEIKDYVIDINKKLTTKTIPKRIQEKFGDIKLCMEQFDLLHGRRTQFIKAFNDFNNAILNYNIHCKHTKKILYLLCNKQGDGKFRQVELHTDDELKKMYHIKHWQLPKWSDIPKSNLSKMEEIRIRKILQNKNQTDILIKKSTRWTKIPVRKWYLWNKKPTTLSVRISEEEFIKKLTQTDNKNKGIILIPIIEPHQLTLQFAWVILLNINDIEFHIGIALKLTNSTKHPIKIVSIFVNLFDVHHLVQLHHKTKHDIFKFQFRLNDLNIGQGKPHKKPLHMSKQFDVSIAPSTVSGNVKSLQMTKSSLNPHCNEFFPGVTSWEHTTKLSSINEESNTNI